MYDVLTVTRRRHEHHGDESGQTDTVVTVYCESEFTDELAHSLKDQFRAKGDRFAVWRGRRERL